MDSDDSSNNAKRNLIRRVDLPQSLKAIWWWNFVLWESVLSFFPAIYSRIVRRMFWGRGSLYKSSVHLLIGVVTVAVLLSGVTAKLQSNSVDALASSGSDGLFLELVAQGTNIAPSAALSTLAAFSVEQHTVAAGETLDALAAKYGVNKNTIKWSNTRVISPYNDNLTVGSQLLIPDFDGVLYEVRSGDTLDSILALTKGDRETVQDVNGIEPDTVVSSGQFVFVPNGTMPPPPPLGVAKPARGGYLPPRSGVAETIAGLPLGFFDSPLTHPQCNGFRFSRGINLNTGSSGYHTGVDWTKSGGCPIRAVGPGVVTSAGVLDRRAGYSVIIDHGNGVQSHYYHALPGSIWVRAGQRVEKGDDIMYMGRSGVTTGVHLHFTLKSGGALVDPQRYVPF